MLKSGVPTLDKWHQTKIGHLVFGLVELAIAYSFASWAIDRGSFWQYLLAVIFFVGGLQNLVGVFRSSEK